MSSFEVVIRGSGSNAEEWLRAQRASDSELETVKMDRHHKDIATRWGIPRDRYARHILALRYGRERLESEGRALGQHVVEFLREAGETYKLLAVIRDENRSRWMLRIDTPKGQLGVPVAYEVADDVIEFSVLTQMDRLREIVLEGIGRGDLIAERSRG